MRLRTAVGAVAVGLLAGGLVLVALVGLDVLGDGNADETDEAGWQLTIYYTPVDRYHSGPPRQVSGCLHPDCGIGEPGDDDLGSYPGDFIDAVQIEGNGRITQGPHARQYLNWTDEAGFWLDVAPRDRDGGVLVPFVSASADPDVLAVDTTFQVDDCGVAADGTDVADEVCERVRAAEWVVGQPFGSALAAGGARHLDIYVGEESSASFTQSGWFTTLTEARLSVP